MAAGDIDDVLDLLVIVAAEKRFIGTEAPIDRAAKRARFLERLESDRWGLLLATDSNGRVVGQIGLKDMRGLVEIGMLVAPEHRGAGIGSTLLQAALDWAGMRHAYKMTLQVWPHNEAARRLYEKFGFVEEGYLKRQWKRRNARSGTRSSWACSCEQEEPPAQGNLDLMSDSTALIRVPDLARLYDFGPTHPLRPERVLGTLHHVEKLDIVDKAGVQEVEARRASDDEVLAVHSAEFVHAVRDVDAGAVTSQFGLQYGLGTPDNPIFPDMHTASSAVCGASVTAAEVVAKDEAQHSFNPAGGLHHARRTEASGFCIYNDPAVAIARVLALRPDWRVMYIDVDVHHGDGVQWIFYGEPRVLTLSLHQSGRYLYPGTGFTDEIGVADAVGTSANLPLMPLTGNDDYLWSLDSLVNGLAEAFKPDLVVTQLGADTHYDDPLANLGLTMEAYPTMARILHDAIHRHASGRWVATGGGGYQAETVVPKIWTIHFAELCGIPEVIPEEWLRDRAPDEVSRRYRDSVAASVEEVLAACVPHLEKLASR